MMASLEEERRLGPFHGRQEESARLQAQMALWTVVAVLVLRRPWLLFLTGWRHDTVHAALLVMGDIKLFYVLLYSFMGASGFCFAYSLYGLLGRRTAEGGADAEFLDCVRQPFASLLGIGAFLFLWLMMPSGLTAAR